MDKTPDPSKVPALKTEHAEILKDMAALPLSSRGFGKLSERLGIVSERLSFHTQSGFPHSNNPPTW